MEPRDDATFRLLPDLAKTPIIYIMSSSGNLRFPVAGIRPPLPSRADSRSHNGADAQSHSETNEGAVENCQPEGDAGCGSQQAADPQWLVHGNPQTSAGHGITADYFMDCRNCLTTIKRQVATQSESGTTH